MIAVCRLRYCERTRSYATRRTAEGKTKTEIIRCLKRYIARELYYASKQTWTPPTVPIAGSIRPSPSPAAPDPSDGPSEPLDIYRNVRGHHDFQFGLGVSGSRAGSGEHGYAFNCA
jgi:hypothetical protein